MMSKRSILVVAPGREAEEAPAKEHRRRAEVRAVEMFNREELKGSEIREHMRDDEEWRAYLPEPVVEVVEEVDGVGRIQQVTGVQRDENG